MIGQNFDLERELAERSPLDWKFGAASPLGIVSIPVSERAKYLPQGELQYDAFADFSDCASRSPVNHAEALLTYHYQHEMLPATKRWLEEKGYIQNGKVVCSDRFIAVLSGTTRQGNSLKSPVDTIRTRGLIPKSLLPKNDSMTWDQYYDRTAITPNLINLGLEFVARLPFLYDQVDHPQLLDVLKYDMVGVAGYAWNPPVNGVYQRVDGNSFNHAFLVYNLPAYQIFDNYYDENDDGSRVVGDFTKSLAPDYIFYEYGYRMFLSAENVVTAPVVAVHLFLKNLIFHTIDPEVAELQKALILLSYPIPHAVSNVYGTETRTALAAFQAAHSIVDDGTHFGPQTRFAMNKALNPNQGALGDAIMAIRTYVGI